MPRTARVVIDGRTYHVLARGNNRQAVFHQDRDFERYLQLLSLYTQQHDLQLYHYALMPSHVHLILEVARGGELSKAMRRLNLAYALFYRKHYAYSGHLWHGRFTSRLIDRESQLLEYGRYVELHPVRAGLVKTPATYPWTSYHVYAEGAMSPLIALNPIYELLGPTPAERQDRYASFIEAGLRYPAHRLPSTPHLFHRPPVRLFKAHKPSALSWRALRRRLGRPPSGGGP